MAAAATPTPTTMASGDTDGILEVNRRIILLERGRKAKEKRKRAVDERKEGKGMCGGCSVNRTFRGPTTGGRKGYLCISEIQKSSDIIYLIIMTTTASRLRHAIGRDSNIGFFARETAWPT